MSFLPSGSITCFAPAKVNLYLHITGRQEDGYHTLDSLIAFADAGDVVTLTPAREFSFDIDGPFAENLAKDKSNLVIRTVETMASASGNTPDMRVTLTKNLPVAAGIGGGSADAAATVKALIRYWRLPERPQYLPDILLDLGADTPVCFYERPARMQGIGEIIAPVPSLPPLPVLLVNPRKACATPDIFRAYDAENEHFKPPVPYPENFENGVALAAFLAAQNNDLQKTASAQIPEIAQIIGALERQKGCMLARLSGSGATCFGIFETPAQAKAARFAIAENNPVWWLQDGLLSAPDHALCRESG